MVADIKQQEYFASELETKILSNIEGTEAHAALDTFSNLLIKYIIVVSSDKNVALDNLKDLFKELEVAINKNYSYRKDITQRITKRIN